MSTNAAVLSILALLCLSSARCLLPSASFADGLSCLRPQATAYRKVLDKTVHVDCDPNVTNDCSFLSTSFSDHDIRGNVVVEDLPYMISLLDGRRISSFTVG